MKQDSVNNRRQRQPTPLQTRRSGGVQATHRWPATRLSVGFIAVAAVLLVAAGSLIATTTASAPSGSPSSPSKTATDSWSAQISRDYAFLDSPLASLLQTFQQWRSGTSMAPTVTAAIDVALPEFLRTTAALAVQAPLPWTDAALKDYRASAQLYVQAIEVEWAAADLPNGALQGQLQNSAERIRELGDSVYNQATAALAPYLPAAPVHPDVTIERLAPVPNWATTGLLPGPPLDLGTSSAQNSHIVAVTWKTAVAQSGIPSARIESAAIRSGGAAALDALGVAFQIAATSLALAPTPAGGHSGSIGLRLCLLVDAEATRSAEAARMLPASPAQTALDNVAEAVALIGNELWDPQLGPRSVGFSRSVLQQAGP